MQIIDILRLILLILLCSAATVTDIKQGIISNRLVLIAGVSGIILSCFEHSMLMDQFFNCLILVGFGLFFYGSHIWAGGDTKLLIAAGILYPPSYYWEINGSRRTLVLILLFAFIAGFIWILLDTLFWLLREKKMPKADEIVQSLISMIKSYLMIMLYVCTFASLYNYILVKNIMLPAEIYTMCCFLIAYLVGRVNFFKERALIIINIVFNVGIFVLTSYIPVSKNWRTYGLILVFMIIKILSSRYNYREIMVSDIRPGMILSKGSSLFLFNSRVPGLPTISDETLKSRLSSEEVDSLNRWKNTKTGRDKLVIVRKIPFAVFIAAGITAYILIGKMYRWY